MAQAGVPSTLDRVDLREALDRMERLQREREALDGSYGDLKSQIDSAYDTKDPADRERRLGELLARFARYIDMERRQSRIAVDLVMDAYQHLVREAGEPPKDENAPS